MTVIAGKYEVVRQLGEGSSGQVHLVRHTDLGVHYALKILDRSLSENPRFIERFKREAEVILRFSHEGSVQLRDFGRTEEGLYYMAMDYCEGILLKDFIQSHGVLPLPLAFDIMIQLLNAIEAAHGLGLIHRDIKPDNVILEGGGETRYRVRVLDFGIAKLKESVQLESTVTIEGASIGTPQYMSPEQASGENVLDHRVDIYASGVVFYELLTGQVPFRGKTVLQTLLMHLTNTPALFAEQHGYPLNVEALVLKALEKNPDDRFSTAQEFSDACKIILESLTVVPLEVVPDDLEDEEEEVDEPMAAPVARSGGSPGNKILCLDDNEMILNIMKHLLEGQGYEVYTATNCSAIHQYVFNDEVKLLISDVQMPDMHGTKVCEMLKKNLSDLKVLLFSNLPDRELEKMSAESKADGWISKNARPDQWLQQIKAVMNSL